MKKWIGVLLAVLFLAACGSDLETSQESDNGKSVSSAEKPSKESKILSADEFVKMFSDIKKYKGDKVEFYARVFTEPEKDDEGTYLQAYAGNNSDRNILIAYGDPSFDVSMDDIIFVSGTIKDEFEGENMMGGTVIAPIISADKVELSNYATAFSPAKKTVEINKEIDQHGFLMKLSKIEFAEDETRLYISINNNSQNKLSFYSFNSKIVVGNQQLEPEDNWEANYPEIQSEILPGIVTEGIIRFPAIPESGSLKVILEGYSDDYMLDFTPFEFEITY